MAGEIVEGVDSESAENPMLRAVVESHPSKDEGWGTHNTGYGENALMLQWECRPCRGPFGKLRAGSSTT